MQTSFLLTGARLIDRDGIFDIRVVDGIIETVVASDTGAPGDVDKGAEGVIVDDQLYVLDAEEGLAVPYLIDPHLHLDLAYSADLLPPNLSGTLIEAIGIWSQAKVALTPENVAQRAERAIREEVAHGVGLIRSHVDVASAAELRLLEGVLAAVKQCHDVVDVQLVAFPQDGLIRDPAALSNMRAALGRGANLVGGIPHIERTLDDAIEHIRLILQLAEEFDADIDVHIDETDDPMSVCVEHLANSVIKAGWQGRVTASHVCSLASQNDVHASKVISLLAEAGIKVVSNPQVNLHLQGRFDGYPKRRGLTRVRQLLAAGVPVGAGQDCICDPFYPLGTGNLMDVAHTLVHAEHMSTEAQMNEAFACISTHAADVLGIRDYGLEPGDRGSFVVFPTPTVRETLRLRPAPLFRFRDGRQL